jgi:hypothetical protein
LLSGFGVTLIGQILVQPAKVRWEDPALAALMIAVVLFFFAIQIGFNARQWRVEPAELTSWWPDHDRDDRWQWLRTEQERYADTYAVAADRFRRVFNAGLLVLLVGIGVALVPEGDIAVGRGIAIGVVGAAVLLELSWLVANWSATLGAPGRDPFSPRRLSRERDGPSDG